MDTPGSWLDTQSSGAHSYSNLLSRTLKRTSSQLARGSQLASPPAHLVHHRQGAQEAGIGPASLSSHPAGFPAPGLPAVAQLGVRSSLTGNTACLYAYSSWNLSLFFPSPFLHNFPEEWTPSVSDARRQGTDLLLPPVSCQKEKTACPPRQHTPIATSPRHF